ncbi:hypothetical protein [Mesobacillus foraminis]|nr:hypothetical protein [Mesobacillus foraminis]
MESIVFSGKYSFIGRTALFEEGKAMFPEVKMGLIAQWMTFKH